MKENQNLNDKSRQLEEYIKSGNKLLRCGYTTGTCATLACKACALIYFTKKNIDTISVITPKGIEVVADVLDISINQNKITCAIRKDAGDDIDVTDGMLIYAIITFTKTNQIRITGGEGIGKVTKKGLNQPVGEYAINSTPRKMIEDELTNISLEYDYDGGFDVTIFAPTGEEISKRTFNSNLGIIGGISIIGTTGIVQPQSLQALIDSIEVEVNVHNANKVKRLILTFGNYGENFIGQSNYDILKNIEQIKISNFVGETLDLLYHTDVEEVMIIGHIGKVIKLAGGIMNTHSKYGDCRVEIFSSHSALNGASNEIIHQLMESATTDACIDILDNIGLRDKVLDSVMIKATQYINKRVNDKIKVGIITFSNIHGKLAISKTGEEMINKWKKENFTEFQ